MDLENKKYDLEKAKEDCRRHEDALEEAQSCMCGHCHECGFDPSEMKAALDEVERLRSVISEPVKSFGTMELVSWVNQLQKTISEYPDAEWGNWPFVLMMGVHCENFSKRWHSPTIELMAARIKELEEANRNIDKRRDEMAAFIERLEAAFLEATKEIVYAIHEGRDAPEGEDVYAEKVAREALEQLRAEGKIGGGDGE